jgi:hypothetical protein
MNQGTRAKAKEPSRQVTRNQEQVTRTKKKGKRTVAVGKLSRDDSVKADF